MLSLNSTRLMHWVRSGVKPAVRLHGFLTDMQRSLATILVGTNLMNVLLSTLTAYISTRFLAEQHMLQSAWSAAIACMMVYLGEYIPKLFFTTRPLRRTVAACPVFSLASRVLSPIASFVLLLTQWLVPKSTQKANDRFLISLDYLQDIVNDQQKGADISTFERLMIQRVLSLHTKTAANVMIHLDRVGKVTVGMPIRVCYQIVKDSGYINVPVFNADYSRCVGLVNVLDELSRGTDPDKTHAGDCIRLPVFVDSDELADNVLPLMRAHRSPLIVVRDKQTHRPVGIITETIMLHSITANRI